MFELTFLGTSAGVPTKHRNVSALAVSFHNPFAKKADKTTPWVLIDCGEGTQHQLLHTPLSLHQLRVICITHVHGDHCYGLAGVLASMAMSGRTAPLTLIAPQAIAKLLDTLTLTTELYFNYPIKFISIESLQQPNPLSQKRQFEPVMVTFSEQHRVQIDIIALSHSTPSHAFKLTQTLHHNQLDTQILREMNLPPSSIWGTLQYGRDVTLPSGEILLVSDFVTPITETTAIIVAGDNDTPDLMTDFVADVSLVIHEATYTAEVEAKILARKGQFNPQHCSVERIAKFAQTVNLPNLILTHFSGRYQPYIKVTHSNPNMGHIHAEVQANFYGNYWLANDFDRFTLQDKIVKFDGNIRQ